MIANSAPATRQPKQPNRRIISTCPLDPSVELVEEFDANTDLLLVRKSRKKSVLGREGDWVYEVGEPSPAENALVSFTRDIQECVETTPKVTRRDSLHAFVFRIRNLPYPKSVYAVTIEGSQIVVRTTNKKYFTRLSITDLDRINFKTLQQSDLSVDHQNDTLIISYQKPAPILENEAKDRQQRKLAQKKESHHDGADHVNKIKDECKTQ
ncbi:hypothetical protein HDU77_010549 [Chytriomyces hyalinus]|nr:hypothetical protein HDU77_010549 [Chytriomyces hyalinus]